MQNVAESDPIQSLVLDANAAAGTLQRLFGSDVTASPVQCDGCRREGMLGEARAYMQAPGVVLRCKACNSVMLRVLETPNGLYLDARGLAYICLPVTQT